MKSRSEYGRERRSFAARMQDLLRRKAAAAQARVYSLIIPLLTEFESEAGRLVFNVANISRITQVRRIVDESLAQEGSVIARWIAAKVLSLADLNRLYFKSFTPRPIEQVEQIAKRNVMLRLGYDIETGDLIRGGYLDDIARNSQVGQVVGSAINRSLGARMGLREFQSNFKAVFTNPQGLGLAERHFYTNTFDLFQQYDRSISKEYADQLNLNYAVYSGTTMSETRPFCSARVGKVFTRKEVESWRNLSFQGKPKNYNPSTDLGGYNCRHSLDWISDELAARFGRDVEADQNQTVEA